MQDSHRQLILILIAVFTILQLVILVVFGYTPYPDSDGYLYLAQEAFHYGEPYPVTSFLNDYPFLWNIGSINITVVIGFMPFYRASARCLCADEGNNCLAVLCAHKDNMWPSDSFYCTDYLYHLSC